MKGKEYVLTTSLLERFRKHLALEEKSRATIEKYSRDVRAFALYAGGKAITKECVIAYKSKLEENGYMARSINSILASVNSLFTFLGWFDLKVKAIKMQRQIYCPEEKELKKEEYLRLVRTAERRHCERLGLIIQTICATGIRVSELESVTVEGVRRSEMTVC